MWWMLGAACNGVIAIAYFMISYAIARPLVDSRQLRTNALGAATAAIFLTCAVHHGAHVVHMLMPYAGVDQQQGMAMRKAWGFELAMWDLVGAVVAVYYWTLRGGIGGGTRARSCSRTSTSVSSAHSISTTRCSRAWWWPGCPSTSVSGSAAWRRSTPRSPRPAR